MGAGTRVPANTGTAGPNHITIRGFNGGRDTCPCKPAATTTPAATASCASMGAGTRVPANRINISTTPANTSASMGAGTRVPANLSKLGNVGLERVLQWGQGHVSLQTPVPSTRYEARILASMGAGTRVPANKAESSWRPTWCKCFNGGRDTCPCKLGISGASTPSV